MRATVRLYAMLNKVDDVAFGRALLNDLEKVVKVDPKRIFATGISNGGMMAYRLASELSDRIAAIAPVGGPMGTEEYAIRNARCRLCIFTEPPTNLLLSRAARGPRASRRSTSTRWNTRSTPGSKRTAVPRSLRSPSCPIWQKMVRPSFARHMVRARKAPRSCSS